MRKKPTNPLIPFENKWVALTQDRKEVIAASPRVEILAKKLEKMDRKKAILTRVLPFDKYYSP